MGSITPGKIALLVVAILVIVISLTIGILLILGAAGLAPDNFCKMNAAANSLTPASWWKLIPNFACHAKEYPIDAYGSDSIFVSAFGRDRVCKCSDFYGDRIDYAPLNLIDNNINTLSHFPIINNKTTIYFSIDEETTLGELRIDFYTDVSFDYKIITQKKEWFWTVDKLCAEGSGSNADSIIANLDCNIDATKHSVKLILDNLSFSGKRVSVRRITMKNNLGDEIDLKDAMYSEIIVNEIQEDCLKSSREEGIEGCTPEWQKKWVEKELVELIVRCWSMGGNGRYYGAFECFEGCVYYNSSSSWDRITRASIVNALDENYFFSNTKEEYLPFSEIISEKELLINTIDHLENRRCFFIKYNGRVKNLMSDDEKAQIVVTFGRTIAEAKRKI